MRIITSSYAGIQNSNSLDLKLFDYSVFKYGTVSYVLLSILIIVKVGRDLNYIQFTVYLPIITV